MEKTGYYREILARTVVNWASLEDVLKSAPWAAHVEGLDATAKLFEDIGASGDIELMINAEELYLIRERDVYGQEDPTVLPSLKAALADFAVIKSSLSTVRSPEQYQTAATTYHDKDKRQGIVIDGCHRAIGSHLARLGNRLSAVGLPLPEKAILRQRRDNLQKARTLYADLQRRALGDLAVEEL
jgi:hypothetical protein